MKKVLVALGCLVMGGIGLITVLLFNLGPVVKTAVNFYGPEIIGSGVGVEAVDASIFSAQAHFTNFFLDNPDGFTAPRAMEVHSLWLNVDASSLMTETIIIDRIEVAGPEINYEIKGGTNNFSVIMKSIKDALPPEKMPDDTTGAAQQSRKLLVRYFVLKGGRVNMTVSMLQGKVVTAEFPDIVLQNIGGGKGGASPDDVLLQIFDAIHGRLTSPELTAEFVNQLKSLGIAFDGRNINEWIRGTGNDLEGVKSEIKSMGERIKGLFHR